MTCPTCYKPRNTLGQRKGTLPQDRVPVATKRWRLHCIDAGPLCSAATLAQGEHQDEAKTCAALHRVWKGLNRRSGHGGRRIVSAARSAGDETVLRAKEDSCRVEPGRGQDSPVKAPSARADARLAQVGLGKPGRPKTRQRAR